MKRERLLQSLLEASGRRGVQVLEVTHEAEDLALGVLVVLHVPGSSKSHPDRPVMFLRQVTENVPLLVSLASLNLGLAEDLPDSLVKPLRSVEDEQVLPLGIEPAADEIVEQAPRHLGTLRNSLPETEDA